MDRLTLTATLLPLLLIYIYTVQSANPFGGKAFVECPGNNRSAELSFVKPIDQESFSNYPKTAVFTGQYRPVLMSCCSTGFSHITWYKDGVELGPSHFQTHEYQNDSTREILYWYSIEQEDCAGVDPRFNHPRCTFACKVTSTDGLHFLLHNITATIFALGGKITTPKFTIATAELCLTEGEDMNVHCQLRYAKNEPLYPKLMFVTYDNGTSLPLTNSEQISVNTTNNFGRNGSLVDFYMKVRNVGAEWLNMNYTCFSKSHKYISRSFHVALCDPVLNATAVVHVESSISVQIAVPLAAVLVLIIASLVVLVRCNVYLNTWYRIKVLQRLSPGGGHFKYDAYLIYARVSHPAIFKSVELLEKKFKLKLCLPDRDFIVGAISPEMLSEGLRLSDKVIIFLSNDMFTDDNKGDNWSDVSLSLSLALNKKLVVFMLEDIESWALKGRKELRAALKILDTIKYSDDKAESILTTTYSEIFKRSA